MNLEIIRTQTTWNDAAGSINSNYAKIADAIAQLKANGGGGTDIDLTDYATKLWVEAKGYITASALTPYALKTDIPSLAGYATEDFVNNQLEDYATQDYVTTKLVDYAPLTSVQGFENRIGGLESAVPTLNAKVNEVEGDVATLSEDITKVEEGLSSLEETLKTEHPTNGDLESAIVELNISQYLTKTEASITYATIASVSTLQTTLEAAITKKADSATTLSGYGITDAYTKIDVDKLLEDNATKTWVNASLVNYATVNSVTAIKNTLTGQIGAVGASVEQLAATKLDSSYFTLANIKSTLGISDWALAATKPSYAWNEITSRPTALSQFTDDVVAGNYLRSIQYSTEWDANAIFNAGIYSGLIANLPSGSPYGRILSLPYYFDKGSTINNFVSQLFITNGDDTTTPNEMYFRTSQRNSWNAWNRVITDNNIGNYNAGSATKLQTPRTLWGQSFDGTNNVSGAITLGGDLNNAAGGIYIHNTNEINSFNGKLYLNHRGSGLTGYGSTNDIVMVRNGGKVGIGTVALSEMLEVGGNIKASGNINATSITINGVTITASNGSITVNGNVFATGDITGGV